MITFTAKEIAEQLGLPVSTVYWRIWQLRHNGEAKISKPFDQTTLELVRDFRTYKSGQTKKDVTSAKQGRFQKLLELCGVTAGATALDTDSLDSLAVSLGYKQARNLYDRLYYTEQLLQRQITDPEEFRKYVLAGKNNPDYQALKDTKLQTLDSPWVDLPSRCLKFGHIDNRIRRLQLKETEEWKDWKKSCYCSYKSIHVNYVIAVLEYALDKKWIDHETYWKMRDACEERV